MSKILFKEGDPFVINGDTRTIKVVKKDFSNQQVKYRLDNDELINQEVLVKIAEQVKPQEPAKKEMPVAPPKKETSQAEEKLKDLQIQYAKLVGKIPPTAYKNNAEWLQSKIDAELSRVKYEALVKLSPDELVDFIQAKDLEIDPNDYAEASELLKAVCEELNIEIPA
jgi:hypothetical protein